MPVVFWTALLLALETRAATGINTELRAGRAPVVWGGQPQATIAWTTSPNLTLLAYDSVKSLTLTYAPRILLREPNIERRLRPIILHQATLRGASQFGPNVSGTLSATGAIGELDYSAWQQVLGNTGANVPRTNRLAQAAAQAGGEFRISPTLELQTEARAGVWVPLSQTYQDPVVNNPMGFALARLTTVAFEPRLGKRVSPRNQVTAGVDTAYYSSSNGLRLLTMNPEVGTNLKLDRQGALRVAVGLTVARDLRDMADRAPGEKSESRVTPSANVRLTRQLAGHRSTRRLESELVATTAYFVDPVLGRGRLRGTAMARLRAVFTREWSAGLELTFSTSLMKHPLLLPGLPPPGNDPTMPGRGYPYETVVAATLPVRWQFSRTFELEGGGRYVDRGPHMRAPGFSLQQRETWLYVLLTATYDFGHRRPATTAQAQ